MLLNITTTSAGMWQGCHEKWRYAYDMMVRPAAVSFDLAFGTTMHQALEIWFNSGKDMFKALESIVGARLNWKFEAQAMAMMTGYHKRWVDDPDLDMTAAEVEFSIDRGHYTLSGKMDGIGTWRGKNCIVEHKTTRSAFDLQSLYVRKLDQDLQIGNYLAGAVSIGHEASICVYDILGKPRQRPYKAGGRHKSDETYAEYRDRILADMGDDPDKYFRRVIIHRQDIDRIDNLRTMNQVAREISDRPTGPLARTTHTCTAYNRECEYFKVCNNETDITNKEFFRQAESAHEELKGRK